MNTYTLHVPRDAVPGDPGALEQAELVKDGFSWGAFFFTVLWFFFQRLWLAGLIALAGLMAFAILLQVLDVNPGAAFLAQILVQVLIGLEANSLKRWTYARHGRPAVALVCAFDEEEAEGKAFGRWLSGAATPRPPAPAASAYRPSEPVIGLFPEAERPR